MTETTKTTDDPTNTPTAHPHAHPIAGLRTADLNTRREVHAMGGRHTPPTSHVLDVIDAYVPEMIRAGIAHALDLLAGNAGKNGIVSAIDMRSLAAGLREIDDHSTGLRTTDVHAAHAAAMHAAGLRTIDELAAGLRTIDATPSTKVVA